MRRYHYSSSIGERHHVKATHALVILFVLVLVSYFNSLFNPFMWDDRTLILTNEGIREGLGGVLKAFSPTGWGMRSDESAYQSYYRPFHTIHMLVDYSIWGLKPFGFHLSNMIAHLVNTCLLYFFAVRLTDYRLAPLIAAAFFAVHPVHTESVTFISARVDLLCSMFMLASLLMYSGSGRPREIFTAKTFLSPGYLVSLLFFLCALLSKEMALTLPVLVALYALFYEEPGMRLKRVVPFFVLLALYILFRVAAMSSFMEMHSARAGLLTVLLTASAAVFDYIRLLVVPWPLKAFYPVVWHGSVGLKVALSFVLIAASAFTLFRLLLGGARAAAFSLLWTYLTLVPVLNIGALGEFSIAERYLYIPSIGAAVLFGVTVTSLRRNVRALRKAMPYVTVAIIILFVVLTVKRNRVWSDDVVFYSEMVRVAPNAAMPHANLSHAYSRTGQTEKAISELETAVRLAGPNPELLIELGGMYVRAGRHAEAVPVLREVTRNEPAHVGALVMLGVSMAELGRLDEAEGYFLRALEADPGSSAAAKNLSRLRAVQQGPGGGSR